MFEKGSSVYCVIFFYFSSLEIWDSYKSVSVCLLSLCPQRNLALRLWFVTFLYFLKRETYSLYTLTFPLLSFIFWKIGLSPHPTRTSVEVFGFVYLSFWKVKVSSPFDQNLLPWKPSFKTALKKNQSYSFFKMSTISFPDCAKAIKSLFGNLAWVKENYLSSTFSIVH